MQNNRIVEGALMAAGEPLSLDRLLHLFDDADQPSKEELLAILAELTEFYAERGIELKELASGYCFQVKSELSPWISRLWEERPARYSRALLETLAIIAYRQPVTRAEIEDIRGVSVSSTIMKTLQDREWIRVVGQRDVPGKPSIFATTKQFLDHFNLKNLEELPPLADVMSLENLEALQESSSSTPHIVSVVSEVSEPIDVNPPMECASA
jgi:segregation and condensation protein B